MYAPPVASLKAPLLFIGHGSPMNAIEDNRFTQMLKRMGHSLQRPQAILVISAHWLTEGTYVTESLWPKTIHDFGGFPEALYQVQYPAPGNLDIFKMIQQSVTSVEVKGDQGTWGFDHGTWSVLKHLIPNADVPVLQLSIDIDRPPQYHFDLGKQLGQLRQKNILIMGSGNVVHNLRRLRWEPTAAPYDWVTRFETWVKSRLEHKDFAALIHQYHQTEEGKLSVPTLDHYYPLHYVLGAADPGDVFKIEFEETQNASISMFSFSLGR